MVSAAIPTTSASPAAGPRAADVAAVSGPVITRVAGLPADSCDIVGESTRRLLARAAETADRLAHLRQPVVDLCFDLVPRFDGDAASRRKILAGKRAANRLGPLPWTTQVRAAVEAEISAAESRSLAEWTRLTDAHAALRTELGRELEADRALSVERLRAALDIGSFAESLALVTPHWMRYGDPRRRASAHRNLKTLYSYVSRAGLKTSPLSGLTTVGVAGREGEGRSRSRISTTLGYEVLLRLAASEETAGLLSYRPAAVRPGGPAAAQGLLVHSELLSSEGIVWRQDRVVEADHARPWLDAIGHHKERDLGEILELIGGKRPFLRFLRLLDSGVLYPVPPWDRGGDPLASLARLLDEGASSPIPRSDLETVQTLGSRACEADVQGRVRTASRIGEIARGWQDRDGTADAPGRLVYEDRESDLDLPEVLAHSTVREDLDWLTARVRPYVFRSHIYDLLVERFVAEFGSGASCDDPLGFLMRIAVDADSNPPLDRAHLADLQSRSDPGPRARLPVGPTSAPPTAAVLFQFEAEDDAAVAEGGYRMVVNQFSAGSGGFLSRFRQLLGPEFEERLHGHLRACWPGIPTRELVAWSECNTAQAMCSGLLPPLLFPGEVGASGGTPLRRTVITHDAETDTLSLVDRTGRPIGLAYLGLVPQHLLQSYVRLLAVLADPWINAAPYSDYTLPYTLNEHCGPEVVDLPRSEHGRVVTRRASWVVPVDLLPAPGADAAEAALEADAFRRAHGMPEEVFVHQLSDGDRFFGDERKPLWVSLASPLSLEVLRQWIRPEIRHVRMVEALPRRTAVPQRDTGGRRRVTEHAALVHWKRTGEDKL